MKDPQDAKGRPASPRIPAVIRDAIARRLRARGLRVTAQRVAVLQVLAESTGHPTVGEIYALVRRRFPMISLNTVYVTLTTLRARGDLIAVESGEHGALRFESNPAPHHHLVCLRCRRIQDVRDPALDAVRAPRRGGGGFTVVGHRVEFFGYCPECREAAGPRPRAAPRRRQPRTR